MVSPYEHSFIEDADEFRDVDLVINCCDHCEGGDNGAQGAGDKY